MTPLEPTKSRPRLLCYTSRPRSRNWNARDRVQSLPPSTALLSFPSLFLLWPFLPFSCPPSLRFTSRFLPLPSFASKSSYRLCEPLWKPKHFCAFLAPKLRLVKTVFCRFEVVLVICANDFVLTTTAVENCNTPFTRIKLARQAGYMLAVRASSMFARSCKRGIIDRKIKRRVAMELSTGCSKKCSPLKFFAVFSAIA